jgi:hypothetical protein
MPLRNYLAGIAIFANEVKGKSALALSRDLGVQYKTSFVLAHKLREAMASELKGMTVGGPGRTAEVDGGYFGGYVKPANYKENRRDRRLAKNQNGKRQVVVVVREREGRTLPAVFKSESAALGFITSRVAKGTEIVADEAGSWNDLQARFAMQRIDHQAAYSDRVSTAMGRRVFSAGCAGRRSGITTTSRATIWSGMPRKRLGARITGGWITGGRFRGLWRLAMAARPSVDWCGYWQRAQKAA